MRGPPGHEDGSAHRQRSHQRQRYAAQQRTIFQRQGRAGLHIACGGQRGQKAAGKNTHKRDPLNARFTLTFVWRHVVRACGKSLLSVGLAAAGLAGGRVPGRGEQAAIPAVGVIYLRILTAAEGRQELFLTVNGANGAFGLILIPHRHPLPGLPCLLVAEHGAVVCPLHIGISGEAFPIILPEESWTKYALEGGELMGVASKGAFRMCAVA